MLHALLSLIEQLLVWISDSHFTHRSKPSGEVHGLGVDCVTGGPFHLNADDLAKHAYILGSTGSGKTTLILSMLQQDIAAGHSIVVVDLRGDLVNGVLELCRRKRVDPSRIHLIDLREREFPIQGFNPLRGEGEPSIRALHVLDLVGRESQSWGVQLEESFRAALLLLAAAGEPLTKLDSVFHDRLFRLRCLTHVSDEHVLGFWKRFDSMQPTRQQTFALPVMNKIAPLLAVPALRGALSGESAIDLPSVLRQPGSILLVSLAVDELQRSGRMFGSLLVSAIAREVMANIDLDRRRNAVRLYVDEFENMASEGFESLIAEGRRFGLTLVLSHQTLAQLTPKLRSVIRNNAGIQIIFQCGFEDASTIAREFPEDIDAEAIRELEVGQAFVMYRDGDIVEVEFHPPKRTQESDLRAFTRSLYKQGKSDAPSQDSEPDSSDPEPLEDWL